MLSCVVLNVRRKEEEMIRDDIHSPSCLEFEGKKKKKVVAAVGQEKNKREEESIMCMCVWLSKGKK